MSKFLCVFLLLGVLAHTGYALKCYNCNSKKVEECQKAGKPQEMDCGKTAPPMQSVCYYKKTYDDAKKETTVVSACAIRTPKTPLNECDGIKPEDCVVCETDLCNIYPDPPAPTNKPGGVGKAAFSMVTLGAMYLFTKAL